MSGRECQRQSKRYQRPVDLGADPNGRILAEVLPLLQRSALRGAGFRRSGSRQLRFATSEPGLDLIRVRSFDVATFVAFGSAQLGVAGNDVLMEFDYSDIYAPLDLEVGQCHIAVAATADWAARGGCRACKPHPGRHEIPGADAPPFCGTRHPGRMHQVEWCDRARPTSQSLPSYRRSRSDGSHSEGERSDRDRADRRGQLPADRQPPGVENSPGRGRRLD